MERKKLNLPQRYSNIRADILLAFLHIYCGLQNHTGPERVVTAVESGNSTHLLLISQIILLCNHVCVV